MDLSPERVQVLKELLEAVLANLKANTTDEPATDEAVMRDSLAMLRRYNIRAVTSGSLDLVSAWRAAAPDRIIPAQSFSDAKARTPAASKPARTGQP